MIIEERIKGLEGLLSRAVCALELQVKNSLEMEKRIKTLEDKVTNLAGDNTARVMSENISNRTLG